jgi:hypothetical protein
MLPRLVAAAVIGVSAFAQQPATDLFDKAPPAVDEALRARVRQFFQAHVDGRFRLADEVVAEDSKDTYFAMEKSRYISFEIIKISYSESFTKAAVVTALEMDWRSPRIGVMRVKPPMTSQWKLENGQWCWYVEQSKNWDTPFGKMSPGPDPTPGVRVPGGWKGVELEAVRQGVKVDRRGIRLSSYERSTDQITLTNTMPGTVNLGLQIARMAGLSASLDKNELKQGETATLRFDYEPADKSPKPTLQCYVHVQQTGQNIPVMLIFAIPPEIEKLIPKK